MKKRSKRNAQKTKSNKIINKKKKRKKTHKKLNRKKKMNFKLGFALTLGFLVLVLAASITLAVLYSKKSKNAIPVEKEKPGQFRNPYLASHARALFDVPTAEMRNSSNDATLVGSDLALVSNFHNNEHQLTISTMKAKGKTVFVIDGEPNNLSTAKHADFVITTKRDPKLLPPVNLV